MILSHGAIVADTPRNQCANDVASLGLAYWLVGDDEREEHIEGEEVRTCAPS